MSFWLGAFTALAVWQTVQVLLALVLYGSETTIDATTVGTNLFIMVLAFVAANLIHLGII